MNGMGRVVCNGVICGFAEEVRDEIATMRSSIGNLRDRMTAFEGYLDRIAGLVQNTHRDTMDIRRSLRMLYGVDVNSGVGSAEIPAGSDVVQGEIESHDTDPGIGQSKHETARWLGKVRDW